MKDCSVEDDAWASRHPADVSSCADGGVGLACGDCPYTRTGEQHSVSCVAQVKVTCIGKSLMSGIQPQAYLTGQQRLIDTSNLRLA
jgi:hypothetical protein